MASTQLCVARPSVLLPHPSRQGLHYGASLSSSLCSRSDWGFAPRQKTCTLVRAALAAVSPTDESVGGQDLERRLNEARLRKGRAAMRAWWYSQRLEKLEFEADRAESDYAHAEAFARLMDMEEGRALMRLWWLEHQVGAPDPSEEGPKQGLFQSMWDRISKPQRRPRTPAARSALSARPVTSSESHFNLSESHRTASDKKVSASENKPTPFERQAALSKELAAPLEPSGKQESSEPQAAPVQNVTPYETQAVMAVEQAVKVVITKESAREQARSKPVDDLIRKELEREAAAKQRKAMEAQAYRQRKMDAGRAAMRKWWVREREGTKRALGLSPYSPVWTVVRKDGKGGPVSIGKVPLVAGSDVSNMERVVPIQLPYPTVSRVHARIFGKDVAHHGNHTREYFVVDLKSTNGVRLNGSKRLRPGDEYKLSDGDVLMLGEEAATLTIRKPE